MVRGSGAFDQLLVFPFVDIEKQLVEVVCQFTPHVIPSKSQWLDVVAIG
jgi:hypothetical protein